RVVNQDNGQEIATNDNYLTPPVCVPGIVCEPTAQIQGTGFDPCLSGTANCQKEPVLIITLPPNNGGYVAQVSGVGGVTGIATVEIDEFDSAPTSSKLFNISTRGPVGTGNDIMFGGFVMRPQGTSRRVYMRAWGPTLVPFGLPGALSDPFLRVVNQDNGQEIATNDNYLTPPVCVPGIVCEPTAQI